MDKKTYLMYLEQLLSLLILGGTWSCPLFESLAQSQIDYGQKSKLAELW